MTSTLYQKFIGIDISKNDFVVFIYGAKSTKVYTNDSSGWNKFHKEHKTDKLISFVTLETTGGYEYDLLTFLYNKGYKVHRADTRKVKNFIRACVGPAKTDALDAAALSLYGYYRHQDLPLFKLSSKDEHKLKILLSRRFDLVEMLVQEKNRAKSPFGKDLKESYHKLMTAIEEEITAIEKQINDYLNANESMKKKKKIMMSVPGVGEKTANILLGLFPELGKLTGKQVASLAGVAPHPRDSGNIKGYRTTRGSGRRNLRPILYLCAMAARNSKSNLAEFYKGLVSRGKKPLVALTALMRKIIVIVNARIRDFEKQNLAC